ncbi:hypothetical protein BDV93DRAFT_511666 [Ceratobasidium sp. AG-I]|nr:hypothetical protein BDV93DRAFT_511666 [Ceratobasidium sp. AG-I]
MLRMSQKGSKAKSWSAGSYAVSASSRGLFSRVETRMGAGVGPWAGGPEDLAVNEHHGKSKDLWAYVHGWEGDNPEEDIRQKFRETGHENQVAYVGLRPPAPIWELWSGRYQTISCTYVLPTKHINNIEKSKGDISDCKTVCSHPSSSSWVSRMFGLPISERKSGEWAIPALGSDNNSVGTMPDWSRLGMSVCRLGRASNTNESIACNDVERVLSKTVLRAKNGIEASVCSPDSMGNGTKQKIGSTKGLNRPH